MSERVLLCVDDEHAILNALTRLLRKEGYHIMTASGAPQALEILSGHPAGVILSDFRMPGMNGAEFLCQVKERFPDTVRVLLSGYAEEALGGRPCKNYVHRVLHKPWGDDELKALLAECFERFESPAP